MRTAAVPMVDTSDIHLIVVLLRPAKARPITGSTGAPQPITVQPPVVSPKMPPSAPSTPAGGAGAASPGRGDAVPTLEPQREVRGDEERHEDEAGEIGRRHRKAPFDAELAIRREPEEGEAPGLGEALSEDAGSRHQVPGQGREERIDGKGGDGLARDGENERGHEDVEGEDPEHRPR